MSEIEAAVFGRFLPIKCPDEKVNINITSEKAVSLIICTQHKNQIFGIAFGFFFNNYRGAICMLYSYQEFRMS